MDDGHPEILLNSISRYCRFLTEAQKRIPVGGERESCAKEILPKVPRPKLKPEHYAPLHRQVLGRDNWRFQACGSMRNLEVHHIQFRRHSGQDLEENLVTLCATCHVRAHRLKA
jgi:hypothetical protein